MKRNFLLRRRRPTKAKIVEIVKDEDKGKILQTIDKENRIIRRMENGESFNCCINNSSFREIFFLCEEKKPAKGKNEYP